MRCKILLRLWPSIGWFAVLVLLVYCSTFLVPGPGSGEELQRRGISGSARLMHRSTDGCRSVVVWSYLHFGPEAAPALRADRDLLQ
jgi:hypothetical protein